MFQNLATDIVEVQTLGGIVLLGGDFNAHTATLLGTINISNLCELLQALEQRSMCRWLGPRAFGPML